MSVSTLVAVMSAERRPVCIGLEEIPWRVLRFRSIKYFNSNTVYAPASLVAPCSSKFNANAAHLSYIPLSIDQAGVYIQASVSSGLDHYLDIYHKQCRELMSNSWCFKLWKCQYMRSFNEGDWIQHCQKAQSAVNIFRYFSFLHCDNISNCSKKLQQEKYWMEKNLGMPLGHCW